MRTRTKVLRQLAPLLVLCMTMLVGCGAPTASGSTSNVTGSGSAVSLSTGAADPQGTLKLNGSSALLPLMQLAADWYQAKHPGVYFVVAGSNSGAGRRLVCEGSIDLGTSDVPLTAAEQTKLNCSNAVQIPVAIQAFAPVANQRGPGKLTSLTKAQLVDIFSGKVANWKELGGDDQAIVLINRAPGSGTRANMTKYLFDGDDSKYATSILEDDNTAVEQAVRETPGALSYLGLAYLSNPALRVLGIDKMSPTKETIQAGGWPIGGPGYAITKGQPSALARDFLAFLTSPEFQNSDAFQRLGFVPLKQ
jgi:phosphate transport system substrate-binding protein